MILTFATLLLHVTLAADPEAPGIAGDIAFFRIDYPTAVSMYESALEQDPVNAGLLWRLARVYVCMGEVADRAERSGMFRTAEEYARRCIMLDSTKAEGHTWLAGALGYMALEAGKSEQLRLSFELVREVRIALKLNPRDDAAYSILGSFYRALGNVSWLERQLARLFFGGIPEGGFAEAEAALQNAITLGPDIMRHHYELAVLYVDWGRKEEAITVLEHAARLPVRVAIDRQRIKRIGELLSAYNLAP